MIEGEAIISGKSYLLAFSIGKQYDKLVIWEIASSDSGSCMHRNLYKLLIDSILRARFLSWSIFQGGLLQIFKKIFFKIFKIDRDLDRKTDIKTDTARDKDRYTWNNWLDKYFIEGIKIHKLVHTYLSYFLRLT